jgi:hypothetical protein
LPARGLRAVCLGYDRSWVSGAGDASVQADDGTVRGIPLKGVSPRDDESHDAERDGAIFTQEVGELCRRQPRIDSS